MTDGFVASLLTIHKKMLHMGLLPKAKNAKWEQLARNFLTQYRIWRILSGAYALHTSNYCYETIVDDHVGSFFPTDDAATDQSWFQEICNSSDRASHCWLLSKTKSLLRGSKIYKCCFVTLLFSVMGLSDSDIKWNGQISLFQWKICSTFMFPICIQCGA